MLWQRNILASLCLLVLGSCGFTPLYEKKHTESRSKIFAGVQIETIKGRDGQRLKIALEDRLNPEGALPSKPAYRLAVDFATSVVPIGVARDGTVSRFNVYNTSHYVLYRNDDGKAITSGDLGYVNSFNNLVNEYFSTYISEDDAVKRNIQELSELYRQRLTEYLDAGAPEQAIKPANIPTSSAYTPVPLDLLPGSIPGMPTINRPGQP